MKKKSGVSLINRPINLNPDTGMVGKEFTKKENPVKSAVDKLLSFSIEGETILKALVCAVWLIIFSLFQTTLFARFRPFGAVPDLILPLVCAVGMSEKEKWGAVFGVIAAFVIESLGGATVTILPLLYMPAGYLCGILTTYYFRDSVTVRGMYVLGSSVLRAVFTLFTVLATVGGVTLLSVLKQAVLPELAANIVFGLVPHYTMKLCLRPFNKTREEKVK